MVCVLLLGGAQKSVFADDYVLGPGDVLTITVYGHDDLKTTVRVTNNGNIVMPLIGQVKVGGMKISDAVKKLTALFADGYLVNPQVNIFIEEYRSKKAIVLGYVNHPGIVELRGHMTFFELLSKSGGLKEGAGDTATIKRKVNGKEKVIVVDLKSLIDRGDLSKNVPIHDGDTVYIAKGGTCYVTGEVNHPDAYTCDNVSVLKMIALAGGFTGKASKSSVKIVRMVNGKKKVLKDVNLDTPVKPDDIIVVPESFF
ncbi:MAG TPA: periplasmic polysaccharide biosynthesis/export protein [Desulfobulbus sp.]|nr:periplasmic polysaccharide biosynthesis/export protein [Desulfobulbus sp.]